MEVGGESGDEKKKKTMQMVLHLLWVGIWKNDSSS
jgi:hypothetical protein